MKEECVIEPHKLTRLLMIPDKRPNLTCSQTIIVFPFPLYVTLAAMLLDHGAVVRLEHFTPTQPETIAVVSDIQHLPPRELVNRLAAQTLENFSAIGNRRIASALRRLHAVEPNLHGPIERIGLLVMKQDGLVLGMIGRRVDALLQFRARRRTLAVFHQRGRDGPRESLELRDRSHLETAEEYRTVSEQLLLDEGPLLRSPINEINFVHLRFYHERQTLFVLQLAHLNKLFVRQVDDLRLETQKLLSLRIAVLSLFLDEKFESVQARFGPSHNAT